MTKLKEFSLVRLSISFMAAFALFAFVQHASASGSGGGGGNELGAQKNYDRGKKLFLEKVVCEECPYSEMELVAENAKELLPEIKRKGKLGKGLSYNERWALRYFIKKRFSI